MLLNILNVKVLSNAALLVLTFLAKEGASLLRSSQSELPGDPVCSRPQSIVPSAAMRFTPPQGLTPLVWHHKSPSNLSPLPVSPGFACQLPVVVLSSSIPWIT